MQAIRMQAVHGIGTVMQHSALVDRTFVGDLTFVDGGWLRQQAQTGNAAGAARTASSQGIDEGLSPHTNSLVLKSSKHFLQVDSSLVIIFSSFSFVHHLLHPIGKSANWYTV